MHVIVAVAAAVYLGNFAYRTWHNWYWRRRAARMFAPGAGLTHGVKKRRWWSWDWPTE